MSAVKVPEGAGVSWWYGLGHGNGVKAEHARIRRAIRKAFVDMFGKLHAGKWTAALSEEEVLAAIAPPKARVTP